MSEQLSPEALVALLNTYFEQATEVLTRHGATLDKFIGDAIMCFWNAPLPQEDHAVRACLAALELVAVVERLAAEFEARGCRGSTAASASTPGQAWRATSARSVAQDYTVIGDSVNLASRLEGAAKVYGTRTLVAEDTLAAARGEVLARELDWLRVKGKQQPVRVFELLGLAGTALAPAPARFARGLALYRERRLEEARGCLLLHRRGGSARPRTSSSAAPSTWPSPPAPTGTACTAWTRSSAPSVQIRRGAANRAAPRFDFRKSLRAKARRYSTVTLLARLRGWSTSFPRRSATWYASSCSGTVATTGASSAQAAGMRMTSSASAATCVVVLVDDGDDLAAARPHLLDVADDLLVGDRAAASGR